MTWELIRVTGIVALGLLTVAVTLGILGPVIRRPALRLTSVTMHLTAAVGGIALVAAHVGLAVVDSWVSVPLLAAVVPGASPWSTLGVALGTLAVDLLLVLAVTSAVRQHAPGLWWRAHVLAYPAWALVWLHTLAVGTDRTTPLMTALAAVSAALVAGATALRLTARRGPVAVQPRHLEEIPA
jgi:sulfoxide reductase heme-binding subunit YedZ